MKITKTAKIDKYRQKPTKEDKMDIDRQKIDGCYLAKFSTKLTKSIVDTIKNIDGIEEFYDIDEILDKIDVIDEITCV